MFAVLWDMFKDDPRSQWLPLTYLETEKLADMTRYDRKPMFSREGDCATLQDGRHVISKFDADVYGEGGFVAQELALLPQNTNYRTRRVFYPLLGVWMVDGEPVGMGLWTNLNPITSNSSTFVPHVIECAPEVKYVRQPVPKIEEIETALAVDTYENVGFVGHNRQRDCFHT